MHVELWLIHTNDGLCEILATYFFQFSIRQRGREKQREECQINSEGSGAFWEIQKFLRGIWGNTENFEGHLVK